MKRFQLFFLGLLICGWVHCQNSQDASFAGIEDKNTIQEIQGVTGIDHQNLEGAGISCYSGCTGNRSEYVNLAQQECIAMLRIYLEKACSDGSINQKRCAALKYVSYPVSSDCFQFDIAQGVSEEMKADLLKLEDEIKDICKGR